MIIFSFSDTPRLKHTTVTGWDSTQTQYSDIPIIQTVTKIYNINRDPIILYCQSLFFNKNLRIYCYSSIF